MSLGWQTQGGWLRFVYVLGISLAVAALSWHLFEKPLNALKKWIPYVRPVRRETVVSEARPRQSPPLCQAKVPRGRALAGQRSAARDVVGRQEGL
jgi:peptidoglycan/LPS O-acetylase OafA/YrhL